MTQTAIINQRFATHFGGMPDLIARAPGRVNLIGEHTDYNDGFVLPCAIGVATHVGIRRRADHRINLIAADFGDATDSFALDAPVEQNPHAPWANYVRGMIAELLARGWALCGADIVIAGDVPQGAGLSSSASLEVAVGAAFRALCGHDGLDATELALIAQAAECDFVGCKCGIMDQLVSARGIADHALLIDCRSLVTRAVPVPADIAVLIVHSGISRGLVDGAYNERRAQCEAAARHLGVAALRDADMAMLHVATGLDALAIARARHVISENARTLAAADALAAHDLATLGNLMAASHVSMRDDFAITLPAIDKLVALLQGAIGAQGGARMTGGGFGGAVVALLPISALERVQASVRASYRTPAGEVPAMMVTRPAAGAGARFGEV